MRISLKVLSVSVVLKCLGLNRNLNATPRQGVGGDGDGESMESPLRGGDTGTKIGIKSS